MDEIEAPPVAQSMSDVLVEPTNCVKCGQDLLGQRVSGVCPGCQSPVVDSLASTAPSQTGSRH